ncbi:unnamed protein product [Schistosoma mattheei]|uniref:Uncharacterized protein n=1 Tax=Schistosoma mattheei TaxID=31246 RepID=A0A3P8J5W7_9TREM|nr:unnamed protein product [Schistosoma mattheei]
MRTHNADVLHLSLFVTFVDVLVDQPDASHLELPFHLYKLVDS